MVLPHLLAHEEDIKHYFSQDQLGGIDTVSKLPCTHAETILTDFPLSEAHLGPQSSYDRRYDDAVLPRASL